MAKTIEFTVEIAKVMGGTEIKTYTQKSVKRLLSTFPKPIKKRWLTISWEENGETIKLDKETYINQQQEKVSIHE